MATSSSLRMDTMSGQVCRALTSEAEMSSCSSQGKQVSCVCLCHVRSKGKCRA